ANRYHSGRPPITDASGDAGVDFRDAASEGVGKRGEVHITFDRYRPWRLIVAQRHFSDDTQRGITGLQREPIHLDALAGVGEPDRPVGGYLLPLGFYVEALDDGRRLLDIERRKRPASPQDAFEERISGRQHGRE